MISDQSPSDNERSTAIRMKENERCDKVKWRCEVTESELVVAVRLPEVVGVQGLGSRVPSPPCGLGLGNEMA